MFCFSPPSRCFPVSRIFNKVASRGGGGGGNSFVEFAFFALLSRCNEGCSDEYQQKECDICIDKYHLMYICMHNFFL